MEKGAVQNHLLAVLKARAAMVGAIRAYFSGRGFMEVATPLALPHPNLDPNVRPVPVTVHDFDGNPRRLWLHTSPELAMKKLLARGAGSIFQVVPVFRDGEVTSSHRCEFTMLEWYRSGAGMEEAVSDAREVIRAACRAAAGSGSIRWGGKSFDLDGPWHRLSMAEAFRRHAGVGALNRTEMALALRSLGYSGLEGLETEELFHRLYLEKVEPNLGREAPAVVSGFPSFLGTMARPSAEDPDVLDRFEVFVGGLELANGYAELADPDELRARMEDALRSLDPEGSRGLTVDGEFLDLMSDLPPCAGVSVGVDRLLMLALGCGDIGQVVYPYG